VPRGTREWDTRRSQPGGFPGPASRRRSVAHARGWLASALVFVYAAAGCGARSGGSVLRGDLEGLQPGATVDDPTPRLTWLEPVPGARRTAWKAVSGDGKVVVGEALFIDEAGGERVGPIVWTRQEGTRELEPAPESNSPLVRVSFDGTRRGGITTSEGSYRPYFWRSGEIALVPAVGSLDAMSDGTDWLAGSYLWVPDYVHAYRWSEATGRQDLGTLEGEPHSSAVGITNDGAIVIGDSGERAYRWTEPLGMVELFPLPGKTRAHAVDMNADGELVVGVSGSFDDDRWAFTLWQSGVPEELPGLSGATKNLAAAMNADGSVIVGESGEAALWTRATGTRSIRSLLEAQGVDVSGAALTSAVDVSHDGAIVLGKGSRDVATEALVGGTEPDWWIARVF